MEGNEEKMKKKTAIVFAASLTAALAAMSGRTGQASAILSHTVVIGNSSGTVTTDWNEMLTRLDAAILEGKGQNVDIMVGDSVTVSTDILNHLAGKNATLALHMGDGLTFSVSGMEIQKAGSPLQITLCGESGIPGEVERQALEDITISRRFCMSGKDAFPCRVNVHLSFGTQNAGRHAVLYYYDEFDGTMKQEGFYRIQESGNAMFGLTRGDEYIVVVMKGYTVKQGDTLSQLAADNGISLKSLMAANPRITDSDHIREGQLLNIPAK